MSLLETWNEGAAQWLDVVWRSGIATTVAALVVALVWLVVRRWSSAHLGYALFSIPLVLLAVPATGLPYISKYSFSLGCASHSSASSLGLGRNAGGNLPCSSQQPEPRSTSLAAASEPKPTPETVSSVPPANEPACG